MKNGKTKKVECKNCNLNFNLAVNKFYAKDYKAKMNHFPPISNGGNEIIINKKANEDNMTVTLLY